MGLVTPWVLIVNIVMMNVKSFVRPWFSLGTLKWA